MTGKLATGHTAAVAALGTLPARLRAAPWFATLGRPLGVEQRAGAAAYLAGLGFPGIEIAAARDWGEAGAILDGADWSRDWWQAEEERRLRLTARAHEALGEAAVLAALSDIALRLSQIIHGAAQAAARAAAESREPGPALIRAAAGAATTACYQAALETAVQPGGDRPADGPFLLKLRLFEAGRWPLSLNGTRFFLF